MSAVRWRWEEKDFGFRFQSGLGKKRQEYYQAANTGEFYIVPANQRKFDEDRLENLCRLAKVPTDLKTVENPWQDYQLGWDWTKTADGIPINYAGCLNREEISRREDEGVARAMELITSVIQRSQLLPITIDLIRQIHVELMGEIYPFAGKWRAVALHKGDGPTKWPLPPMGIQAVIDTFAQEVLSRTPFQDLNNTAVCEFCGEVMNELIAIHPFREGNGRVAFIVVNLILMQNNLLPLDIYDEQRHQERYYAACETGRIHRNYSPLADLIEEWEDAALAEWEGKNG